jgi:hypothetical protein
VGLLVILGGVVSVLLPEHPLSWDCVGGATSYTAF